MDTESHRPVSEILSNARSEHQDAEYPTGTTDDLHDAASSAHEPAHRLQSGHPVLLIVMGVSGTGKTTLAEAISAALDIPYVEGDHLHPKANIDKMSNGHPLTDADREPWLELIRSTAENMVAEQQADPHFTRRVGAVITCSALRRYYRDILRGTYTPGTMPGYLAPSSSQSLPTYFVFIKGDRDVLLERMKSRQGHYMKASMLDSQFETLESPEGELGVIVVSSEDSTEDQKKQVLEKLKELAV